MSDRSTLKGYFNTGDRPTENQFSDLIDSLSLTTETDSLQSALDLKQNIFAEETSAGSYRVGNNYSLIDSTVVGSWVFDGTESFPNKLGINNTKPVSEPAWGTRSVDSTYVAGGADVAAILAGYGNVNNALAGIIASQHSMLYTGADHASIFGGSLNTIYDDTDYSTIIGGTSNKIEARGRYAAIISGDQNIIETGASDDLSGFRSSLIVCSSCVVGGRNNVMLSSALCNSQSTYTTIFAGYDVTVAAGSTHQGVGGENIDLSSATNFAFAWGRNHTIGGAYTLTIGDGHTIGVGHDYCSAIGNGCVTPFSGAHVFGARQRSSIAGYNQALDFTCSQETTNTTVTRLSVTGSFNYPVQPADSIVSGFALVTGVSQAGVCSTFRIDFTSERIGTGTPTIRANTTTTLYNGLTIVTVPTMVSTTGGIYRIQVVGIAATNISWDSRIVAQQIVYTA